MFEKTAVLMLCFYLLGCTNLNLLGECGYEYKARVINANSNYEAVHFIENCGATSDFYTLVQIRNIQNKKNENVLLIKGHYDKEVKLSWKEKENLRIEFSGDLKYITNSKPKFEDIAVELYKDNQQVTSEELEKAKMLREKEYAEFR